MSLITANKCEQHCAGISLAHYISYVVLVLDLEGNLLDFFSAQN